MSDTFEDDLQREEARPGLNATAVWLDGQPENVQAAFMAWLACGKSKAALFRTCQKYGLTISAVSSFREHCREILESGQFEHPTV